MDRFNVRSALVASAVVIGLGNLPVKAKHYPKPAAQQQENAHAPDQLAEALAAKDRADKAFEAVTTHLVTALDHDNQYRTLQNSVDDAQIAYDALANSGLASLQNNPAYKTELAARDRAHADLERARAGGQATDEEKTVLAKEAMSHNTAIHKIEADAFKNIPGLAAAKAKWLSASAEMTQMKAQYMRQVKDDPQWVAAKAAADEAHQQVAEAERAVARMPDHTRGPIAANPITRQPIAAEPVTRQPIGAEPITAQPIKGDVRPANPIAARPQDANPIARDPKAANPVAAQPVKAEPKAANPVPAEPKPANPVPANPVPAGPPNN